jgi:hypothetical protein
MIRFLLAFDELCQVARPDSALFLLIVCGVYWFYYRDGSSTDDSAVFMSNKDAVISEHPSPEFDLQMGCADPSLYTAYHEDAKAQ